MPYAIEGVVFSYAKIADLAVHAETKDGKHQNMLLYKLPGGDKTTALMNYLDLTSEDAYKTDRGDLYFTSDTLIDALSDHLNTAESQTKNALEAFILQNGTSMPKTDGTGHTSAAELEQGLYLFVETQVPETVSNTTAPFLLSLPMTSIDGMNWNYDVTVYPKNERTAPTLEKTLRESKADTGKNDGTDSITDGYAHTATGSIGDVIEYQILSALPSITSRATSFSEYTYTDTLSAGLSYRKNDVRMEWFSDKSCTEESRVAVWTEQDGKFAVSYSALGDKSVMRIKMTDAAVQELCDYFTAQYEKTGRKVIVAMAGDHAPSFVGHVADPSFAETDNELQILERSTPFFIWANYPLEHTAAATSTTDPLNRMDMVMLTPTLLQQAGLPLSDYYEYLLEMKHNPPVVTAANDYMKVDGTTAEYGTDPALDEWAKGYLSLEYNNIGAHAKRDQSIFDPAE